MEKTDTDAIQEINTNTRSMKLCANVYPDESKLGLYLLTKSLVPREVQRMIVYKMTPPPLDVRPKSVVSPHACQPSREQWKLRPDAWKIPDCLRRAEAASWTERDVLFYVFLPLASAVTICPCSSRPLQQYASSSNRVLLVFSVTSFAKLVAACLRVSDMPVMGIDE
jgi:hypothetical protein